MPLKIWKNLHSPVVDDLVDEEEEEGGDYLFDPEAGKASDDPFAHLADKGAPSKEAASDDKEVSKYVTGEEE